MQQVLSSKYSLHSVSVVLRAFCLLTPDFTQCIKSHSAHSNWPRLSSWVQFFPICLFSNGLNFSVSVCLQMGSIFPYVSVCSWVQFFLICIQLIPVENWTNGKVWAFHKCVTWWNWHLDTIQVSGCPLSLKDPSSEMEDMLAVSSGNMTIKGK